MDNEEKILSLLEQLVVGQRKTDQRLSSVEGEIRSVKDDLRFVKDTVIGIENVHGKKLDALFDAFDLVYSRTDNHEERITRLEHRVRELV